MSSFVNYQVHSNDSSAVAAAAAKLVSKRALIGAAEGGWVSLYDQAAESQDSAEIHRVCWELSTNLDTAMFAFVNAQDEMFVYYLYRTGDLIDEYNSAPGPNVTADTRTRLAGQPKMLLPYTPPGTTTEQIESVLQYETASRESGFASAVLPQDRLSRLATLLGIGTPRVLTGYNQLARQSPAALAAARLTALSGRPPAPVGRGPIPPKFAPRK